MGLENFMYIFRRDCNWIYTIEI